MINFLPFGGTFPPPPVEYGAPSIKYTEVPPAAPRPKLWKVLVRLPGFNVEVHYAMASYPGGDLDVDFEATLTNEATHVVKDMWDRNAAVPEEGVMFQRTARQKPAELMIRVCVTGDIPPGPYGGVWSN